LDGRVRCDDVVVGLAGGVFGVRFAGCEGYRKYSSCSESAAGVRASGKLGKGVGGKESGDMVAYCVAPLVAVSFWLWT